MIIALEGVDNSGKTTACEFLNRLLLIPVTKNLAIPRTREDTQDFKDVYQKIYEGMVGVNELYLFDRFFISEMAYSGVKRLYNAADDPFYWGLAKNLSKMPIVIFLCISDQHSLKERFGKYGDDYINAMEAIQIQDKYLDLMTKLPIEIICIQNSSTLDEFRKQLKERTIEFLKRWKGEYKRCGRYIQIANERSPAGNFHAARRTDQAVQRDREV